MENQKIYYKALASCMQNAYVFFFTLGIYFVYIPWNLERLDLVETDLGLWLFIFGIVNLITNQFTGRIIVPKIGTKNIPSSAVDKIQVLRNYSEVGQLSGVRNNQDNFAINSYKRSNLAIKNGFFKNEIIPVEVKSKKGSTLVEIDEEPLKFNEKKILGLKPVFKKNGSITAANASSINDGAAAVLLGSKNINTSLKPIAKIIAHTSFAMEPVYFTKAPIFAIQKLIKKSGVMIEDIDLFEINEAFSCVTLAAIEKLKIDEDKVNIHGGAVSLGHPIGASGARVLVTLLNALQLNKKRYGIACLCIGGGEASAMLVEMI